MGCAGMAGLEEMIRQTAIDVYGHGRGRQLCIVDSVKAGRSLAEPDDQKQQMFGP